VSRCLALRSPARRSPGCGRPYSTRAQFRQRPHQGVDLGWPEASDGHANRHAVAPGGDGHGYVESTTAETPDSAVRFACQVGAVSARELPAGRGEKLVVEQEICACVR
jgi:hypothetical protein